MRDWLTTGDCARVIGMTAEYVRGEIEDGRLQAEVIERPKRYGRKWARRIIRVYQEPFRQYLEQYWPQVRWPAA